MSKRKYTEDYEHLTKKIQKYKRLLRILYPLSQDSTSPIAHTSDEQPEYTGFEPEDWLQDSPEVSNPPDNTITVAPDDLPNPDILVDNVVPALEPVTPSDLAQDHPSASQVPSGDITDADLDLDTMVILGEDPSTSVNYGPDIHKELSKCFQYIATKGLDKDCRKTIVTKYLVPANCHYIAAPVLNAELKVAIPETAAKRDKAIIVKQDQMACAISCLGQVITSQLVSKNNELLSKLMDAARILCNIQHYDSVTRRNFILSALKNDMKEALRSTKIDEFLFGDNIIDRIKSAKVVTKSDTELKPDTANKNPPKLPNNPLPQRHLNRRAPLGAPTRSREPAAPRPPLPPPPPGSSKWSREPAVPRRPPPPLPPAGSSKRSREPAVPCPPPQPPPAGSSKRSREPAVPCPPPQPPPAGSSKGSREPAAPCPPPQPPPAGSSKGSREPAAPRRAPPLLPPAGSSKGSRVPAAPRPPLPPPPPGSSKWSREPAAPRPPLPPPPPGSSKRSREPAASCPPPQPPPAGSSKGSRVPAVPCPPPPPPPAGSSKRLQSQRQPPRRY